MQDDEKVVFDDIRSIAKKEGVDLEVMWRGKRKGDKAIFKRQLKYAASSDTMTKIERFAKAVCKKYNFVYELRRRGMCKIIRCDWLYIDFKKA